MGAMPRAFRGQHIPVTGAPAGPGSRHPPDPVGTRGIAPMGRSYERRARRHLVPERWDWTVDDTS